MAYFSKIDSNNKVIDTIRVEDSVIIENGVLSEQKGQEFLKKIFKEPDIIWKRTVKGMNGGINKNGGEVFRKNFGAIGTTYDANKNAFIGRQLYNPDGTECTTTIFNEDKCVWETPTPRPTEPALSIWVYADIGGWKRIDLVSEGKRWEYNSTDGWVEVDI
jgi:hypothetical protein